MSDHDGYADLAYFAHCATCTYDGVHRERVADAAADCIAHNHDAGHQPAQHHGAHVRVTERPHPLTEGLHT